MQISDSNNYDGWFFVITGNYYLKEYSKITSAIELVSLKIKLNKLLKMAHAK
jgi:hypothetical protein